MDNQPDIIEKNPVSNRNGTCRIISIVLLGLAALSYFLPAFKVSFLGINVSFSFFEIYTGSENGKYIMGIYFICLVLCIIPIALNKHILSKLALIIIGLVTIALPVSRPIYLKLSNDMTDKLSSFAANLINPDIGFYLLCAVGIAMIVVGCLFKGNNTSNHISE